MPPDSVPWIVGALAAALGVMWREHQRQVKRTEESERLWRDFALKGTDLADKATTAALRKPVDDG